MHYLKTYLSAGSTVALVIAGASCSSTPSTLFSAASTTTVDSQTLFNQAMSTLGGVTAFKANMETIASMPMSEVYSKILSGLPSDENASTVMVDGIPLSTSRQKFINSRAQILTAYANQPLSAYFTRRNLPLAGHGTYQDLKTALDLLRGQQPPSPTLGLTVNCGALGYAGDALTIGGAAATVLCLIPILNTIACPIAAGMFIAGGLAVTTTDLAACHVADPAGKDGNLRVANNDGTILRDNPQLTLCQIDPSSPEYDTAGNQTSPDCSAAQQQNAAHDAGSGASQAAPSPAI